MATPLNKYRNGRAVILKRETVLEEMHGRYRGRKLILILEPDNTIHFAIKGTRFKYSSSLAKVLIKVMYDDAKQRYQIRQEEYKRKKANGHRAKKLKPFYFPYKLT